MKVKHCSNCLLEYNCKEEENINAENCNKYITACDKCDLKKQLEEKDIEINKLRGQVELLMLAVTTHNNVHDFLDKKVEKKK